MRILFLVPYPTGCAGSQRFRFEHYYQDFAQAGISYDVSPFLGPETWKILYRRGHYARKIWGIAVGYIKRVYDVLFRARRYDYVFVHRELAPFGPPLLAWWLAKVSKSRIIYDFDDAVWIPNYSESNSWTNYLKRYSNARNLCVWSHKVSCGNSFLRHYALQHNPRAVLNPTVINTGLYDPAGHRPARDKDFVIGWTGSHSTMFYLKEIFSIVAELEKDYDFKFHVISDVTPQECPRSLVYVPWNKATEVDDLLKIDIGLMPLADNLWARGKCGFKALQYMALGIPALVSPVGVNTEIVTHGLNGYHCANREDWKKYITLLINDRRQLENLGAACREVVVSRYSVDANRRNFLSLFS